MPKLNNPPRRIDSNTIAYVHTGTFPSNSPSFTFVTYNAVGMASAFDRVVLIVKKGNNASTDHILQEYFQLIRPDNLEIVCLPCIFRKTNFIYFMLVIRYLVSIRHSLQTVISRNVTFLPYLVMLKKTYHLPVFLESHDFFTDLSLRDDTINRIKKRNSQLERRYIPSLSGLICLQNAQKDLYQKYYPSLPIYVLRTGLYQTHIQDFSERKYLAYIGSFDKHKGLEQIIAAASKSMTKPEVLFIGAKSDNDIMTVQSMAEKYDYTTKVQVRRWVTKQELSSLLQQVKIGIVPITDTFFNRYITSPLKIFDYYAFGIPILATDLPTTRELIDEGKTGFLFHPDDVVGFAGLIDKLYDSPELYGEMVQNVYAKAETLLWSKRGSQFKEILEATL